MSSEAKVGIITVAALLLLFAVLYRVGGYGLEKRGYEFVVLYDYGAGIQKGAPVRLAGVDVGRVTEVTISDSQKAKVGVWVNSDVKLYSDYLYNISSGVLIADKFIDIIPDTRDGVPVKQGDIVNGTSPVRIDQLLARTDEIMNRASVALGAINGLIGDPALQRDFKASISSLRLTTEKTAAAADALNAMIASNQPGIGDMVNNLSVMSANLRDTSGAILEVAQDETFINDTKQAVKNVKTAGAKAGVVMDNVNAIVGDKAFRSDLKDAVREVKETADSINSTINLVRRISDTRVEPYFDLNYLGRESRFRGDVNLLLRPPGDRFFLLGLTDVNEQSRFNLQVGRQLSPRQILRAGLIESSIGTALDILPGSRLKLSTELFNLSDLQLNMLGYYKIGDRWYL
ncbi:MAG: MlaD family protein, partial [bacterium]|nr:MlaD family protein [bacterium]